MSEKQESLWDRIRRIEVEFEQEHDGLWAIDVLEDAVITKFAGRYYSVGYREADGVFVFDLLAQWIEVEEQSEWVAKFARLAGDLVVVQGGQIKALGDGKLGGYLVTFTNPERPDLEGDYFDAKTEFALVNPQTSVYYQHGLDPVVGKAAIGQGGLEKQDLGVWIEAQLEMRNAYEEAIYDLAEQGKMGWSSGTAPNLVTREKVGDAFHITQWPLGVDASLTPTPAEPLNVAIPLKQYAKSLADLEALLKGEGDLPTDANGQKDLSPDNRSWYDSAVARATKERMENL